MNDIQRPTNRRHGTPSKDDRTRGFNDFLEVRRGIEVLVFYLNLAVHHVQGDAPI